MITAVFWMRAPVLLAVVLGGAAGCSRSDAPSAPSAAGPAPAADSPEPGILGHFETAEHVVAWLETTDGPRFTVRTKSGVVLASELTSDEIEKRFPELREIVRSALGKKGSAIFDASAPDDNAVH